MAVRPYRETDFAALAAVYANAKPVELAHEGRAFAVLPLEQDQAILAAFRESDVLVYDDGALLGFAASVPGQLRAMFVHADARGRGVGGAEIIYTKMIRSGPVLL